MTETQTRIAELYYRSNSVRFGAFKLSVHLDNPDLPPSPYYLHYPKPGEQGSELLPELYNLVGQAFYILCEAQDPPVRPQRIAGVPRGAVPLAEAHARHYSNYPNNLLAFTKTERAKKTLFEGPTGEYQKGEELVIDEDHTSGGRNKKLIRAAALTGGLAVNTMLTVVDRQQGGVENLARDGVTLLSVFTIEELLQFGADAGFASQQQVNEAQEYRAANQY